MASEVSAKNLVILSEAKDLCTRRQRGCGLELQISSAAKTAS